MNFSSNNKHVIQQLKSGRIEAFTIVYHQYKVKIFNFVYRHLRSKEDSEEIVQDIFVKIWENRHQINQELSVESYFFTIAKNTLLNWLRKKHIPYQSLESLASLNIKDNQTEDHIFFNDIQKLADLAVGELPPKRKRIYQLSRNKGLSNQEIANKLNISTKTVEAQLTKALKVIREKLNTYTDVASMFFFFLPFF